MLIGADSWMPPTQEVLNILKKIDGFKFYGGYVGGSGLYLNTPWPQEAWDLLKSNGIEPLPIWVPNQHCIEDPTEQAEQAMQACLQAGLTGTVVLDTEQAMSVVMNHGAWIDQFCARINQEPGWYAVEYCGSEYLSPLAFHWVVMWGENEQVPASGEAIQYGPYTLIDDVGNAVPGISTLGISIDGDSADENFRFATFTAPNPVPDLQSPTAPPSTSSPSDSTNPDGSANNTGVSTVDVNQKGTNPLGVFLANDGDKWWLACPVTKTKIYVENKSDGSALAGIFPTISQPIPTFLNLFEDISNETDSEFVEGKG